LRQQVKTFRSATDARRGREAWLIAGQQLLRQGGVGAVKLQALVDELGLTTGSFYHHFSGISDYLDELARFYATAEPAEAIRALAGVADGVQRLRLLDQQAEDRQMRKLDAAMRDWAGTNELAAESVRQVDDVLLRFIQEAFVDMGFDERGAQVRAHLFFAAGIARTRPPWPIGPTMVDEALEVLSRPAPTEP
jgi:AcrR family transcriptional regulator